MDPAMELTRDTFDPESFFSEFWRKKPLYVPGGAADFLGRTWSVADFTAARERAVVSGRQIAHREGEVTFIERISDFDDDLLLRAQRFRSLFGVPEAWFDSVQTYSPNGIGAHFDHSDNFVLQQGGTKIWSLASTKRIKKEEIVRRMMNHPGVGSHPLPVEGVVEFEVNAGDLLYLPLLWIHCGVSRAESLSLSLVCPAVSLYTAVVPLLSQVLKRKGVGYQPIPALHSGLTAEERAAAVGAIRQATRVMLSRITDDDLAEAVLDAQSRQWLAS
jgi:50S ribosomal protein L16 3-hydroxylase